MNKSKLEELIEAKAKRRLNEEIWKTSQFIEDNPFLKSVKIKGVEINDDRFNRHFHNLLEASDNGEEIKERVYQQYIKEETEKLLKGVAHLEYLFERNGL